MEDGAMNFDAVCVLASELLGKVEGLRAWPTRHPGVVARLTFRPTDRSVQADRVVVSTAHVAYYPFTLSPQRYANGRKLMTRARLREVFAELADQCDAERSSDPRARRDAYGVRLRHASPVAHED